MPPNANLARLAQRPILYGAGLRLQADGRTVMVPMHRELARGTLRFDPPPSRLHCGRNGVYPILPMGTGLGDDGAEVGPMAW